jgi:glutamate carboxypeptidase
MHINQIYSYIESFRKSYLADLATLVNVDCGTHNKVGVDWVGRWIATRCGEWKFDVTRLPLTERGDCYVARWRGHGSGKLFIIGHLDTVYPDGIAAQRPMKIEGKKILGPGTCDMKAGVLAGLYAMRALQQNNFDSFDEIIYFFNSDEEIGSPASQKLYLPIVKECDAALVLEAARANGDIVSARKGVAHYLIKVKGKAAHAGVEPEKGANAILELSHQIIAAHKLNGIYNGVAVNAGIIGGGTRANVVPDEAHAHVDVRVVDPEGVRVISESIQKLKENITVKGTSVEIEGEANFPPMPKNKAGAFLTELAQLAARELNFEVRDAATGGASDANMIAGVGVPVLDGLGPVGGLDHSPDEYIEAESIVPRTALLAGLIKKIFGSQEKLKQLH